MKAPRFVLVVVVLIGTQRSVSSQPAPDRPFLVSATYWGGSLSEEFAAVAVDAAGNVYVAGTTASADFPKTVSLLPALGATDVFVSKFDRAGTLVFSTVFGGSSSERVNGMAVDAGGNIIVVGDTFSSDLPVVNPVQPAFHQGFCGEFGGICSDGFAAKLDPSGHSLMFSTYLGTPSADSALDVAVDGAGNMYVVGATESTFEGVTPIRGFSRGREAFVAKVPPAGGTFAYFTYLGGSFQDSGNGIAADIAGNAYVTGVTGSQNFPTLNPIQAAPENFSDSAFITKLDPAGIIAYSTYLGGHASDAGFDIAVEASGSAHVVGMTSSTNFPTANARQPFLRGFNDVFVAKLNPSGSRLMYSTYLGGNDREQGQGILDFSPPLNIALDGSGNAYVTGPTQSNDFPAAYSLQAFGGGICLDFPFFETRPCSDAFVSKLDLEGKPVFSTPIGGSRDDHGRGVAVAPDGTVYVVGTTRSLDFPVTAPLQPTLSGTSDVFIAKISTAPPACQLPPPAQLLPTGGIFDQRPTLLWEAVAGADAYGVIAFNVAQVFLTGLPPLQLLGVTSNTSFTPAAPLAAGDYLWQVVPWNSTCGLGQLSRGMTFTLPGTCPAPSARQISPVGGAVVNNPTRLEWRVDGPSIAALSVVVILRADGKFVAQYPTANNTFTVPMTLSVGDYAWFAVTWNSTCGATVTGPAFFRSSGRVGP
jgi:hypothetical protein